MEQSKNPSERLFVSLTAGGEGLILAASGVLSSCFENDSGVSASLSLEEWSDLKHTIPPDPTDRMGLWVVEVDVEEGAWVGKRFDFTVKQWRAPIVHEMVAVLNGDHPWPLGDIPIVNWLPQPFEA